MFAFGQDAYPLQLDLDGGFAFDEAMYADASLMKVYRGGTRFAKHYLGPNCVPAFDGEKKDGEGEEFDCAVQIDAHPSVRFWLRNLAKHHRSFFLPLSHDSFYPDFVGELADGRLFAVEYKGEHLRNAKDTLEKDDFLSFGLVTETGIMTNTGALMADESPISHSRVFCTRWNGRAACGRSR